MACERHTKIVARVNSPIPARYIGRAPIRSVTTPAHGRTSVDASRLAPMTHAYASGCPSSAMIVGVAVASSVCCSVEEHMPSIAAHNAITTRRGIWGDIKPPVLPTPSPAVLQAAAAR